MSRIICLATIPVKRTRKTDLAPNHRFGQGILPSRPHASLPYSGEDDAQAAAMFREEPLPRPRPISEVIASTERSLAACKGLLQSIDRHQMRIQGVRPLRGGSPEARPSVPTDADWDEARSQRHGDDMEFIGACG